MDIKEVIVVEGRDDTNAINRAVRAVTIETHGFGISKETWEKLDRAYERDGLIISTDPDHSGNEIRKKLKEKYPLAKDAFLSKAKASKDEDVGVENAEPDDIREALKKAKATPAEESRRDLYTEKDLYDNGLVGLPSSKDRRERLGDKLGIGYANGKGLLNKLNKLGIDRETFQRALEEGDKE